MEPQDRLDALLSSPPTRRERLSLPQRQREELESLLEVANDLAAIGVMLPASTFADDLEARLLARAGYVRVETVQSHDAVENAPTLPSLVALDPPGNASGPRARRTARGSLQVSWRIWSSLAAAILLALTVTTFTVAANASPGSAFYGVRRWQEDARTNLANSDADRAKLHIQYATDALDALDSAVAQHAGTSVYNEALGRFTDEFHQANDALALVPYGSDHDSVSASLEDLRARGRDDLRAALAGVGWPARITTTRALGDLGDAVVTVTQVKGLRVSAPTGRVWTVTITGSEFQNGAILLVRQRPAGHVVSVTSTQVVALLIAGEDDSLPHDIGVGNPDNTAATTAQVGSEHDDDDTPNATGTPSGTPGARECENEPNSDDPPCTPTPSH